MRDFEGNTKYLIYLLLRDALIIAADLEYKTSDEEYDSCRSWNWNKEATETAFHYVESVIKKELRKLR